jgi:hypothetical protein
MMREKMCGTANARCAAVGVGTQGAQTGNGDASRVMFAMCLMRVNGYA